MDVKEVYDVVVLGAGVEGSATAYNLVKSRAGRVLLLEQFSALHTRGSSHGGSRITRKAYTKAFYIEMMHEAFRMWDQVERESKTKLFVNTGTLVFGPERSSSLQRVKSALASSTVTHRNLSASQVMSKWPQLKLPSDHEALCEEVGGILLASKALAALQRLFVEFGGELRDNQKVTELSGDSEMVRVVTHTGAVYHTRKLVITPGAWAPSIMAQLGLQLPFKVVRTEVLYWKVDQPSDFSPDNFPVFIHYGDEENSYAHVYGLPVNEYPALLKVCYHDGIELDGPDNRDASPDPKTIDNVRPFIEKYLKGVATTPSIYEACMYTESPDENPILDRHPRYPNIIFGAGFSGHGFKLAPVVGKVLSELALEKSPSYDLTPFRLSRFEQNQSKL